MSEAKVSSYKIYSGQEKKRRLSGSFRPVQDAEGFTFGFAYRVVAGCIAVLTSSFFVFILGFFTGWQLTTTLLVLLGLLITIIVLFAEHLRSRAYERLIEYIRPRDQEKLSDEKNDVMHIARKSLKYGQEPKLFAIRLQFKYFLDRFLAAVFLILFSPLMFVIAALIRFDSKGPILFGESFYGFDGKKFTLWKFRTHVFDETDSDKEFVPDFDFRFTTVGSVLERIGLEMIPRLFNVLKGEISLVGPRPIHPIRYEKEINRSMDLLRSYIGRVNFKPGVTSWAQINGQKSPIGAKDNMEYDFFYIENWSLMLDLKILFITFWGVMIESAR